MTSVNYYTDIDGVMQKYSYDYHPDMDRWLSECHNQPILAIDELVFLDAERGKAFARCRRCGHYTDFFNKQFRWLNKW